MSMKQSKKCYDSHCEGEPEYDVRGFSMCAKHYVEALEHGADIVTPRFDRLPIECEADSE